MELTIDITHHASKSKICNILAMIHYSTLKCKRTSKELDLLMMKYGGLTGIYLTD